MKFLSLRKLRLRLKFLENFQKITKSVGLISATRYRKAYQKISQILASSYYLITLFKEILKRNPSLNKKIKEKFKFYKTNKVLVVTIASDRGLAGAFDISIFEKTKNLLKKLKEANKEVLLGVIGKKAENYFKKRLSLLFSFSKFEGLFPDQFAKEIISYLRFLIEEQKIEEIIFIVPNLTSAGYFVEEIKIFPFNLETLEDIIEKILPRIKEWQKLKEEKIFKYEFEYILEPSPDKVLEVILENVFYALIYVIILEAQASLELARTITMQRAEKNSEELINKTRIDYNKLRQNKITQEILDTIRI
ncbi:MAG: F0F1 ATP synthase subunit gamma [Candidatus Pacearchaeota archaeon]